MKSFTEDELACIVRFHPLEFENIEYSMSEESLNIFWNCIYNNSYKEKISNRLYKKFVNAIWENRFEAIKYMAEERKKGVSFYGDNGLEF